MTLTEMAVSARDNIYASKEGDKTYTYFAEFPEIGNPVYPKISGGPTTSINEAASWDDRSELSEHAKTFAGKYAWKIIELG